MSPVATDDMDGNGLKLDKIDQFFRLLTIRAPKMLKKFIMVIALSDLNSFDIFVVIMILAQNLPKTANPRDTAPLTASCR